MLAIRRVTIFAVVLPALLLQACASDTLFVRPDGSAPAPQRLEADGSDCRNLGPLLAGFLSGALFGAAEGAIGGAASGDAGIGAAVGAGVGGVIGLIVGGVASASGAGYEECMAKKGYRQAAVPRQEIPPTETPDAPVIEPVVQSASSAPRPAVDDPTR